MSLCIGVRPANVEPKSKVCTTTPKSSAPLVRSVARSLPITTVRRANGRTRTRESRRIKSSQSTPVSLQCHKSTARRVLFLSPTPGSLLQELNDNSGDDVISAGALDNAVYDMSTDNRDDICKAIEGYYRNPPTKVFSSNRRCNDTALTDSELEELYDAANLISQNNGAGNNGDGNKATVPATRRQTR